MSTVTQPIYRAIMLEVERRRLALGLPMEKFSEYAGLCDRFYPKALFSDTPSGRQVQWGTLQVIIDALFPHGFDLEIRAKPGAVISANNLKAKLLQLKATADPKSQRQLMRELGRKGGLVSATRKRRKQPIWKRRAIARKAARARWLKGKKPQDIAPADGRPTMPQARSMQSRKRALGAK
jgi:hypothetical protein